MDLFKRVLIPNYYRDSWFQRPNFFNSVSREIRNSEGFGLCLVAS